MVKIAVLDDFQDIARRSGYDSLPPEAEVTFFHRHLSPEEMVTELQDFNVLLGQRERIAYPRSVLERLPNLKLIIGDGRLNPFLDLRAAHELGIKVVSNVRIPQGEPGARAPGRGVVGETGELTWALIISIMRQIPREIESMRSGGWQTVSGPSLAGKTLGIVGLGNIGSSMARVAHVFGMNVIAWSQNLTADRASELGATYAAKDDLFRQSDVVTIHYALSQRSRGIVGAHELSLMKPTAYLVNTSRGPLVDEAALIDALRNRRIAGAAMDVYDQEPLPVDHPYRSMDNVLATPHMGYGSDERYASFHASVVRTLQAYLAGEPLEEYSLDDIVD